MSILNQINRNPGILMRRVIEKRQLRQIIKRCQQNQQYTRQQVAKYYCEQIHKNAIMIIIKKYREIQNSLGLQQITNEVLQLIAIDVIGQGGNGIVFKILNKHTGKQLLVKTIICKYDEQQENVQIVTEANFLLKKEYQISKILEQDIDLVNHIKKPVAMYIQGPILYSIYEYVEGQNLYELIHLQYRYSEQELNKITQQMIIITQAMHKRLCILHNDIKTDNFIFNKQSRRLYIIDFGGSMQYNQIQQYVRSSVKKMTNKINVKQLSKKYFEGKFLQTDYFQGVLCRAVEMSQIIDKQINVEQYIEILFKSEILSVIMCLMTLYRTEHVLFSNNNFKHVFPYVHNEQIALKYFYLQFALFGGELLGKSLMKYKHESFIPRTIAIQQQVDLSVWDCYNYNQYGPTGEIYDVLERLMQSNEANVSQCFSQFVNQLSEENRQMLFQLIIQLNQ